MGSFGLSSVFKPLPAPAYKITKAALNMLTVQYAQSYAQDGFTFMAISPGVSASGPQLELSDWSSGCRPTREALEPTFLWIGAPNRFWSWCRRPSRSRMGNSSTSMSVGGRRPRA